MSDLKWYAEYDTDGSAEIYLSDGRHLPDVCQLGPYTSFGKCKRDLLLALKSCKDEITGGIIQTRKMMKVDRKKDIR